MKVVSKEILNIKDMIYKVRGKQVILDFNLGKLFEVETKRINEAVKRNPLKFPKEYCFKLNDEEVEELSLRSQIATLNKSENKRGYNIKYLPYAFTEYGIIMIATILKSEKAIKTSINIVNEFVQMKKILFQNDDLYKQIFFIENKLIEHDYDIKELKESFEKYEEKQLKNELYLNGQVYDAYSKVLDILNESKKEIIIIDNYIDKKILDIIKDIDKQVIIITKENSLLKKDIIEKYNKQYNNLKVIFNNTFHDRFIINDKEIFYHLGTSLNYLGEKIFMINQIQENIITKLLLNQISCIINKK